MTDHYGIQLGDYFFRMYSTIYFFRRISISPAALFHPKLKVACMLYCSIKAAHLIDISSLLIKKNYA